MQTRDDTRNALLAALAWQAELGADDAIGEAPLDRFAETEASKRPAAAAAPQAPPPAAPRARGGATHREADARPAEAAAPRVARDLAAAAGSLEELAEAMRAFEGSDLREGARNLVFADGDPRARLMVIGEAPGGDEDRIGRPFVGRAGQLLDRMLGAIGLARTAPTPEEAVYITNILPWRPPGNRTPSETEVQLFLPFVERHIELAAPDVILALGNTPMKALLGISAGITRMRGRWSRHAASGLPLLPSFHPAYLLRQPAQKGLAWRDLLALRAVLDGADPDNLG